MTQVKKCESAGWAQENEPDYDEAKQVEAKGGMFTVAYDHTQLRGKQCSAQSTRRSFFN